MLANSRMITGTSTTAITRPVTTDRPIAAKHPNRTTETTLNGASRLTVAESTSIGAIKAANAKARQTLAMTEPIRLPSASWGEWRMAARAATISSTMLVPKPPTRAPTTVGRTLTAPRSGPCQQ